MDGAEYDKNDTIVVAHSASGMFLPLVAARRPVRHIVFLAALDPQPGASILEQFKTGPDMLNPDWVGKNPMEDAVAEQFLFHDCVPEVRSWALMTMILLNAQRTLTEMCPLEEWPGVASAYIVYEGDRTISPSWSRRVARDYLRVEAIELPGGHCPHVSRPCALADVLTREAIIRALA
jgi:pimeloyl-ACP methyl ester carboxylesterase